VVILQRVRDINGDKTIFSY